MNFTRLAKGSDDAVALFLTEDTVAPSGILSPHIRGTRTLMSGRAVRQVGVKMMDAADGGKVAGDKTRSREGLLDRELESRPAGTGRHQGYGVILRPGMGEIVSDNSEQFRIML